MLGGALIINNVPKAKKAFDKGQKVVMKKLSDLCKKGASVISEDEQTSSEKQPEKSAPKNATKKKQTAES